jgi:WD40 repeat protein
VAGTAIVCAILAALAWFVLLGPALEDAEAEAKRNADALKTQETKGKDDEEKHGEALREKLKEIERVKGELDVANGDRQEAEDKRNQAERQVAEEQRLKREAIAKLQKVQGQLEQALGALKKGDGKSQQAQTLVLRAQAEGYADRVALANTERLYRAPDRGELALIRCAPQQRDWEWRYLNGQVSAERYAFRPHKDVTSAVAYSPDGKQLATGGFDNDKLVRIWDAVTGKLLATYKGHTRPITGLAYSRDGKRLASCDAGGNALPGEGELRVWETETGKLLHTLACPGAVQMVAFGNEHRLAAGCMNGALKLWDADGKEQPAPPVQEGWPVQAVAFSPDGTLVAWSGGAIGKGAKPAPAEVKVWDVKMGQEVMSLKGHSAAVLGAVFQPDGKRLITSDAAGFVLIWDMAARKAAPALRGVSVSMQPIRALAPAADNRYLYVGPAVGPLVRLELDTGKVERRYFSFGILALALHPEGKRLVTAESDKLVHVWDLNERVPFLSTGKHAGKVGCLAFSPDDTLLASSGQDKLVRLWDPRTGKAVRTLEGLARPAVQILFSPDGSRLVAVGRPSEQADKAIGVLVWDTATGKKVAEVPGRSGDVAFAAFGADGKRLLLASPGKGLYIWDLTTRKAVERLDDLPESLQAGAALDCVASSSDGRWIALAGRDGIQMARLLPGAVGQEWRMFNLFKPVPDLQGMAWAPRGGVLALGIKNTIVLWDLSSNPRRPVGSWPVARSDPRSVGLSPNGRRLFGGLGSGELKVWELGMLPNNQLLLSLGGPRAAINCVAGSRDGRRVAAGMVDGSLIIWDADPQGEPATP